MQPDGKKEFYDGSCETPRETSVEVSLFININGCHMKLTKQEAKDLYYKLKDALDIDVNKINYFPWYPNTTIRTIF